jgi:hypothetical protein
MAAGMGFGRSFHNAGLLSDTSLAKVASNSGGTWFLAQFAYSDKFYESVVSSEQDLHKVVVEWMGVQAPLLRRPLAEITADLGKWVGNGLVGGVLKGITVALWNISHLSRRTQALLCRLTGTDVDACLASIDQLLSALVICSEFEGSWGLFIQKMMHLADPSMDTSQATQRDRKGGLLSPALYFQASNMTSSIANSRSGAVVGPINTWRLNTSTRPPPYDTAPMHWGVPSAEALDGASAGFGVSPLVAANGVASALRGVEAGFVTARSVPIVGGDVVPVWFAAALSSAFAAFAGSPNMTWALLGGFAASEGAQPSASSVPGFESELDELLGLSDADAAAITRQLHASVSQLVEGTDPAQIPPEAQALIQKHCSPVTVWNVLPCLAGLLAHLPTLFLSLLADFAVCAESSDIDPEFDTRTCAFPNVRVADGG